MERDRAPRRWDGPPRLRPSANATRRGGLAGDLLPDRPGALHRRRHGVGADARESGPGGGLSAGHVVAVAASPSLRTVTWTTDGPARRLRGDQCRDAQPMPTQVEAWGNPVGLAVGVPADQGESVGGDVLGHADDADISRGSAPDPARHWPERTRAAASGTARRSRSPAGKCRPGCR